MTAGGVGFYRPANPRNRALYCSTPLAMLSLIHI